MKRLLLVALVMFVAATATKVFSQGQGQAAAPQAQGQQPARGQQPQGPDMNAYYQIGPDSLPHDGVPKGDVRGPLTLPSQAYPGTQHTYWVYVPAQYDPAVAASVMIFQDGQAFKDMDGVLRTPNVLDNLIYRREIPVLIGVFINPGRTPEQPEPTPRLSFTRTTTSRRIPNSFTAVKAASSSSGIDFSTRASVTMPDSFTVISATTKPSMSAATASGG